MNLIEKLIRVDKETAGKRETKKIKSKRLTKMLGEDTEITIQEISGRKSNDIMQMMFDSKGNKKMSALYDTNSETNNGAQLNIGQWTGKRVTAIINGGRYSGL